jgi:hypothetical protein
MGEDPAQIDGHKKMKIKLARSFAARLGDPEEREEPPFVAIDQLAEVHDA